MRNPLLLHAKLPCLAGELVSSIHFEDPSNLPPVGCPLLVILPTAAGDEIVRAEREGHIRNRDGQMTYKLEDGRIVHGRLHWTYP